MLRTCAIANIERELWSSDSSKEMGIYLCRQALAGFPSKRRPYVKGTLRKAIQFRCGPYLKFIIRIITAHGTRISPQLRFLHFLQARHRSLELVVRFVPKHPWSGRIGLSVLHGHLSWALCSLPMRHHCLASPAVERQPLYAGRGQQVRG